MQRQLLHLGELNTTQVDSWQHTLDVLHEDGTLHQRRLFTDADGNAPQAEDVVEVKLSSIEVRQPRRFGDCWVGCHSWEQLGLRKFWEECFKDDKGTVPWDRVLELLAVNRLLSPRSELYVHEKWFAQTAMDVLLDCDAQVSSKDRLYRCLDRILEHKDALEQHLGQRWKDLFEASFDILLYDLTSTYLEGEGEQIPSAKRGYSRDHRPDCLQLVVALVVTPEGFPLTYEVFPGNRLDHSTLSSILDAIEAKHGKARRVWVFDRGVVTEDNLAELRARGAHYLVGTPKRRLADYEQRLVEGPWSKASSEVEVQLVPENDEVYVLCRSAGRKAKEQAMRRRWLFKMVRDLYALRRRVANGYLKQPDLIFQQIGKLSERHPQAWRWVEVRYTEGIIWWKWNREAFRRAVQTEGAYLLRAHWTEKDPARLWQTYTQLSEAEAAFRTLKSEIHVRPIWHYIEPRVHAHIMVAFLGYCLWVYLKKCCEKSAPSLTPWSLLDQLGRIVLVDVWFELRHGGRICLPRITQPEPAQEAILTQMDWKLPAQPPPRIYQTQVGPGLQSHG